jgi:hypothetical protein
LNFSYEAIVKVKLLNTWAVLRIVEHNKNTGNRVTVIITIVGNNVLVILNLNSCVICDAFPPSLPPPPFFSMPDISLLPLS